MTPEEMRVRLWRKRFISTGDEDIFIKIWHQVKNLSTPPRNFRELTAEQWDSIRMLAVFEALQEFNPKHTVQEQRLATMPGGRVKMVIVRRESEMTLLSFIRWKMDNALRAERKQLSKSRQLISLDDHYDDDEDSSVTDRVLSQIENSSKLQPSDAEETEDAYVTLTRKVEVRLTELGEPNLVKAFRFRLKHPGITNRVISKKLGVSKTHTSGYFRKIREVVEEVIETTDTTLI